MRHFDDKFDLVTLLILTYYHFAVDDAVKVLIELIASFSYVFFRIVRHVAFAYANSGLHRFTPSFNAVVAA
jgi:hypothetical protein